MCVCMLGQVRLAVLLVFAGMTAKAHFVLVDVHSGYFFDLFLVDFAAQAPASCHHI